MKNGNFVWALVILRSTLSLETLSWSFGTTLSNLRFVCRALWSNKMEHINRIKWLRKVYFWNTAGQFAGHFLSSWGLRFGVIMPAYGRVEKELSKEICVLTDRIVGALE
jgi:hypothetical protein